MPIATTEPSEFKLTDVPDSSSADGPSMSLPFCVQFPSIFSYTFTCPDQLPLPSLPIAPIAKTLPLSLRLTDHPE